jgi:hypothetical protein
MALLVLIVIIAAATLLPSPRLPKGILTAIADENAATGYRQEGIVSGGAFTASAVQLQSNRNTIASLVTSLSGGARVFDRTLVIFNRSDEVLMRRVGLELFERLRDPGRFNQIRYLPAGEELPVGEPLPEVFVTLDLKSWDESGLPGRKEFKGKLVVTASDQFRRSSNSYQDHLTPPQLQYRWNVDLDYLAQQTGIETSGARYQHVSRELADEIAKSLTKMLDDLAKKHGRAGDIPQQFYPAYAPPPAFAFLTALGAQKRIDGPAFMKSALVVWETLEEAVPSEVVGMIRQELDAAGWRMSDGSGQAGYLRATNGTAVLTVFREGDGTIRPDRTEDAPAKMFIVYTRFMATDEVDAAITQYLEQGGDESVLVLFQNAWYRQRERIEEHFRTHPPIDPDSWQTLAQLLNKNDPDAARDAVVRAAALHRIFQQGTPDSSLKQLAKELGIAELPSRISESMIHDLGLHQLSESGEIQLSLALNQPAAIWLGDEGDEQHWLLLTPVENPGSKPQRTLRVEQVQLQNSGWSRSDHTGGDLEKPGDLLYSHTISHRIIGETIRVLSAAMQEEGRYTVIVRRDNIEM